MKRILIFSLVVNFALLALTTWRKPHQVTLPAREVRGATQPDQGAHRQRQARVVAQTKTVAPWINIENQDVRQFVANLRAIGCPEATLRDIVTLRICRAYRERLLEMQAELVLKQAANQGMDDSAWQKLDERKQDLRDEMRAELESALGEDWVVLSSTLTGFPIAGDGFNKTLSADKRGQLREINKQFRKDMQELERKQMIEGLEKDEIATLRTLERQKRGALAAVLSPQELEEYLYRNSSAADYVQRNLPEAKSEAEYRTMVKLALEMEMSSTLDSAPQDFRMNTGTDESNAESKERREEYAQRLKDILGEDRIAEQQAAEKLRTDAEAKELKKQRLTDMAAEAGVNAESASRFFDRLNESEPVLKKKFEEMEKTLSGSPEEKEMQMEAAIKAELNSMAIETMGDKGPSVVEKMMKGGRK